MQIGEMDGWHVQRDPQARTCLTSAFYDAVKSSKLQCREFEEKNQVF